MAFGQWRKGHFSISADPKDTDHRIVTDFLRTSYWASHVPPDQIISSFETSRVYNLIDDQLERQIGFARVITDKVRFAYLCDVFVLDSHQGRGLGKWMIETVIADPHLASVGHWVLATLDAQDFYRSFGFEVTDPGRYMVRKA